MFNRYKQPKPTTWKTFILIFVVLAFAGVLKIKQVFFDSPVVPTADVPAVSFDDTSSLSPPWKGGGSEPDATPPSDSPSGSTGLAAPNPSVPPTPLSYNLAIPFTSQAPYGVWDALHEDACEEASIYMAVEYFAGVETPTLDPASTDTILKDMVANEEKLSLGPSITAAEAVAFFQKYYADQYSLRVVDNPTVDDIKSLVASGFPVIVPAAGRELGNPFFTGEGPLYHMLIIRGYTEDTFITNDPGTRHGENYTYATSVLMDAIGDWNSGDPANGAKRVIVVEPMD